MKIMKCWLTSLGLLGALLAPAHALTLMAGESWSPAFDGLTQGGPSNLTDRGGFSIAFSETDYLGLGDAFSVSFFENAGDLEAVFTIAGGLSSDGGRFDLAGDLEVPLLWRDLEGQITFSMLSGSAIVDSIEFRVVRDGFLYNISWPVSAVPAPAAVWLWAAALPLVALAVRRGRERRPDRP